MVHKRFLSLKLSCCIIFISIFIGKNLLAPDTVSDNCKENFLAIPKKKQEREPRKLKEKIGQELADFIKNMHKNIEINAQICQLASQVLQDLVEQDKNNKIVNAGSKELQECLKELEKNNFEQQDNLEKLNKIKKFFKSGCIN